MSDTTPQKVSATGISSSFSLSDHISISVARTTASNGTYLSTIENAIILMIKNPNAIVKVAPQHASGVLATIQNVLRVKGFPSITGAVRSKLIETFRRSNPGANLAAVAPKGPQTPAAPVVPSAPAPAAAQGTQTTAAPKTVVTPAPAAPVTPVAPAATATAPAASNTTTTTSAPAASTPSS